MNYRSYSSLFVITFINYQLKGWEQMKVEIFGDEFLWVQNLDSLKIIVSSYSKGEVAFLD